MRTSLCTLLLLAAVSAPAQAARIKDLAVVRGVRSNPLVGFGVVIGLSGTGDTRRVTVTNQAIASLLLRHGVNIPAEGLDTPNSAAVIVTAELPPFAAPGETIDVQVSALGNARSLTGGTLVLAPLKGADGNVYAVAQGSLTVGGFVAEAVPFAKVQRNFPTSGRIPGGGTIERSVPARYVIDDQIVLNLHQVDFETAWRMVKAVNDAFSAEIASAAHPGAVTVKIPDDAKAQPVTFLAKIQALEVTPDVVAKVVVNEKTGTVVVGGSVSLGPAAIAHGNLNVAITTSFGVSQPLPFSRLGQTIVVPNVEVTVQEGQPPLKEVKAGTTVAELVSALNSLGASPRDLISILQALKLSGALQAELEVM